MYTLFCRFCLELHKRPRTVLAVAAMVTAIALYFASRLEIRSSLTHVLPDDYKSVELLQQMEKQFGGLGKLSIVVNSPRAPLTEKAYLRLVENLQTHPAINLLDYQKEKAYFEKNKLLYIDLEDLQEIQKRVETSLWAKQEKHNPLVVDLLEPEEKERITPDNMTFEDLEQKYFRQLQPYHGTRDGKALIMHLFPRFDVTDVRKCRSLYRDARTAIDQIPDKEEVSFHFTGEVMKNIQKEGRLLAEIKDAGALSLLCVIVLLALFFHRVPMGPLLAVIPLLMGITWTLGLAYFLVGYLSMITLSLGIILFGLGLDAALHLLSRYAEERRKGLGAEVAFESITLETGPAVVTGAFTTAAAFFSLTVTDFKGFSEFGLIAGVGLLCTVFAILVVFPCFMIWAEPLGLMPVFGPRIYAFRPFKPKPFRFRTLHLILLLVLTGVSLRHLPQHRFEFNFERLGFPNQNSVADSIIHSAGEAILPPAVVMTQTPEEALQVSRYIQDYREQDSLTPTIHSVLSLPDLLPRDQEEKLEIIGELKQLITPQSLQHTGDSVRANLEKLREAWDVQALALKDLPASFWKKFEGRNQQPNFFTYIFPAVDVNHGLNCLAFAEDTRTLPLSRDKILYASGMAILYADLLSLMIPDSLKALGLALSMVFLLVLLDTRSLKGTLVLFVPLVLGLVWTLGLMKILHIRINYYNLVAFPAILGIGIDNGVHLYHRYWEEGAGSLRFVMARTGKIITVTSLTSVAGFFGLLFSSHQGLFSLGLTAALGITFTLIASLLFVPFLLSFRDDRYIAESAK